MIKNSFSVIKNIFKSVNITVFLVSFFVGLLFIYFFDDKKRINVYPTLHNCTKIEYKDKAENCFEYGFDETTCPSNKKDINSIPVQ